ncbi:MAG: hypothetical protein ACRDAQ_10190 [Cetobacterium sp.]
MEDYINQISRYYFKNALSNPAILKLLEKKEVEYKIKDQVIKELDGLLDFINEIKDLNFNYEEIKTEISLFLKEQKYLCNLNEELIDLDSIKKETNDIVITEIHKEVSVKKEEKQEIIKNNNDNIEFIQLIEGLNIDKDFTFYFIFDYYYTSCKVFISDFSKYAFSIADFNDIATFKVQEEFKKKAIEFCINMEKILKNNKVDKYDGYNYESIYKNNFLFFYDKIFQLSKAASQESSRINTELLQYKELQKASRKNGSSFFIGNLYAMGIYGAIKGVGSIYKNISDSSQRRKYKNIQEESFMNEYYSILEEILKEVINEFKFVYEYITFGIITIQGLKLNPKSYNFLCKLRGDLDDKIKDIDLNKFEKNQLSNLINNYGYSLKLWDSYYRCLNLNEMESLNNRLIEVEAKELVETLLLIKEEKIVLESIDLWKLSNTLCNDEQMMNLFKKRFNKEISRKEIALFKESLNIIFNKKKNDFPKNEMILLNLIKNNLENNLETYFLNHKIEILYNKNEIIEILNNNTLLVNFFQTKEITKFIKENYEKYISEVKEINDKQVKKIQLELNNELNELKKLEIHSRGIMKFLVLSNCFNRNIEKIEKILNKQLINQKTIHLNWDTSESVGISTLSSLIYKESVKKEYNIILIKNIDKVRVNSNSKLEIEVLQGHKYIIPIFDKLCSEEETNALKSLAIYIKQISNLWKGIVNISDIYIKDYFQEIDELYSIPNYLLEFVFNSNLTIEKYFKIFLKNGFVDKNELELYENKLEKVTNIMRTQIGQSKKIILYPNIPDNLKSILQDACKGILQKSITDEIVAVYFESDENENLSLLIITEKTLIITRNEFGEIPLNIIKDIQLKGFANHTLEININGKVLKCLLSTNEDDNKIFTNILKIYLSEK